MSLVDHFWRGLERRNLSLTDNEAWREIGWLPQTASGVRVTPESAMRYSAVFACVRVLAGTMAQLPLIIYQRQRDGGRSRAADFYLYDLLHRQPNPLMTSFNWRMSLQNHLATWGNAYAEIERSRSGRVRYLWPLRPDKMEKVEVEGESLVYHYRLPDHTLTELPGADVLHLRFMSPDGITGYSPIALHRQGIGLGLAAEEFGARFFGNDARPGVVLEHPGQLSDGAHQRLKESWESKHQGLSKSHRVGILEEGMKLHEIGIPPEDAQYIELRKFQKTDIAGIYGVPPHMIADLERATFSNIEHQGIEFVVHTMGPWLACWEQGLDTSLMTPQERQQYYTEFLVEGLLRGDSQARAQFYTSMFQIGAFSQNDIRQRENENPIEGGDTYFVPLNMIPATTAAQGLLSTEPAPQQNSRRALPAPDGEQRAVQAAAARHRLQQAQMRVYGDVAGRLLRREANDVGNAARRLLGQRSVIEFDVWLRDFYKQFPDVVADNMRPVAQAYAELVAAEVVREVGGEVDAARLAGFVQAYVADQGVRHARRNEARLRDILVENQTGLLEAIEAEVETWRSEDAANRIALEESVRTGNAVAHLAYLIIGVTVLRWVAIGKSCPFCTQQNGRVVSITEVFVPSGSTLDPEGATAPLQVTRNIGHPPLHGGCDCQIVAG